MTTPGSVYNMSSLISGIIHAAIADTDTSILSGWNGHGVFTTDRCIDHNGSDRAIYLIPSQDPSKSQQDPQWRCSMERPLANQTPAIAAMTPTSSSPR